MSRARQRNVVMELITEEPMATSLNVCQWYMELRQCTVEKVGQVMQIHGFSVEKKCVR